MARATDELDISMPALETVLSTFETLAEKADENNLPREEITDLIRSTVRMARSIPRTVTVSYESHVD